MGASANPDDALGVLQYAAPAFAGSQLDEDFGMAARSLTVCLLLAKVSLDAVRYQFHFELRRLLSKVIVMTRF